MSKHIHSRPSIYKPLDTKNPHHVTHAGLFLPHHSKTFCRVIQRKGKQIPCIYLSRSIRGRHRRKIRSHKKRVFRCTALLFRVGGLISASKAAAEDELINAVIIEEEVKEKISITYHYESTPEEMRLAKEFDLAVVDQFFNEACLMTFDVALKNKENRLEKITLLQGAGTPVFISTNQV
jgi:hypothetical protein